MTNVVRLPPRQVIERLISSGYLPESKRRQIAAIEAAREAMRIESKLFFLAMKTTD